MYAPGYHHVVVQGAVQTSLGDADAMRFAGLDRELMSHGRAPHQAIVGKSPFLVSYRSQNQATGADEPATL